MNFNKLRTEWTAWRVRRKLKKEAKKKLEERGPFAVAMVQHIHKPLRPPPVGVGQTEPKEPPHPGRQKRPGWARKRDRRRTV